MAAMTSMPFPGVAIKAERERRGLTQTKLAELANVRTATISRIEAGISRGRSSTLERVVGVLGLDPLQLFQDDDGEEHEGAKRHRIAAEVRDNHVRGQLVGIGAPDGDTADISAGLEDVHLARGEWKDEVWLSGVMPGAHVTELRTPLEVWHGGQLIERYTAGWLFVVDTTAQPQDGDLVVCVTDQAEGVSEMRRFEAGPRGIGLLFELSSDNAVTDAQMRIVGVVVDKRPPVRR